MISMYTVSERPGLWERRIDGGAVWPEYNRHGDVLGQCWDSLDVEFADYQFVLYDENAETVLANGYTGPFDWDGDDETLPDGFDAALELVFRQGRAKKPVNTLCALAAEIPNTNRSRGLATPILAGMRTIAERHGLKQLVAPVRPSWKERYPLAPIERYMKWRREDGLLLDPWMRVHERLGARVARPLPHSLRITGTVAEWESWTGLAFPESGDYVFPQCLAPVHIDHAANLGLYWEPNVWMVHPPLR